jgi:ribA/ribD-fused uncharacterized protein
MAKRREKFTPFYGGIFSQWHPAKFTVDGIEYNCAEQYMMAQKAQLFGDFPSHTAIMKAESPLAQKALGKKVKGFDRLVWEAVARDVVMRGSMAKFLTHRRLLTGLMNTRGTTLVEASETDVIWGVGLAEWDPRVHHRESWQGRNWLGQVLTDLRGLLMTGLK